MTWDETTAKLNELRKWFYDYYEAHTPEDIRKSEQLRDQAKSKRAECVAVHNKRIQMCMQMYKVNK